MNHSSLRLGLLAALSLAAFAACGGGPSPAASTAANATPTATTTASATASTAPASSETAPASAPDAGATMAPPPDAGAALPQSAFARQAAQGNPIYQKWCAECHDSDGSGTSAPAVVGLDKGALPLNPPSGAKDRKGQFKTAFDVGDFVAKAMPPDHIGALKPDELWAVMAFDLKANGIDLGEKTLDATVAKTVLLRK